MGNVLTGTVASAQENKWINGEIFETWLKRFINYLKPTKKMYY